MNDIERMNRDILKNDEEDDEENDDLKSKPSQNLLNLIYGGVYGS